MSNNIDSHRVSNFSFIPNQSTSTSQAMGAESASRLSRTTNTEEAGTGKASITYRRQFCGVTPGQRNPHRLDDNLKSPGKRIFLNKTQYTVYSNYITVGRAPYAGQFRVMEEGVMMSFEELDVWLRSYGYQRAADSLGNHVWKNRELGSEVHIKCGIDVQIPSQKLSPKKIPDIQDYLRNKYSDIYFKSDAYTVRAGGKTLKKNLYSSDPLLWAKGEGGAYSELELWLSLEGFQKISDCEGYHRYYNNERRTTVYLQKNAWIKISPEAKVFKDLVRNAPSTAAHAPHIVSSSSSSAARSAVQPKIVAVDSAPLQVHDLCKQVNHSCDITHKVSGMHIYGNLEDCMKVLNALERFERSDFGRWVVDLVKRDMEGNNFFVVALPSKGIPNPAVPGAVDSGFFVEMTFDPRVLAERGVSIGEHSGTYRGIGICAQNMQSRIERDLAEELIHNYVAQTRRDARKSPLSELLSLEKDVRTNPFSGVYAAERESYLYEGGKLYAHFKGANPHSPGSRQARLHDFINTHIFESVEANYARAERAGELVASLGSLELNHPGILNEASPELYEWFFNVVESKTVELSPASRPIAEISVCSEATIVHRRVIDCPKVLQAELVPLQVHELCKHVGYSFDCTHVVSGIVV